MTPSIGQTIEKKKATHTHTELFQTKTIQGDIFPTTSLRPPLSHLLLLPASFWCLVVCLSLSCFILMKSFLCPADHSPCVFSPAVCFSRLALCLTLTVLHKLHLNKEWKNRNLLNTFIFKFSLSSGIEKMNTKINAISHNK